MRLRPPLSPVVALPSILAGMPAGLKRAKRKAKPACLPKLPANGYKGVRKCGKSFQGYTPNKTNFTEAKPTATAAARALANKEFTAGSAANRGKSDTPHTPTGAPFPLSGCGARRSLNATGDSTSEARRALSREIERFSARVSVTRL